MLCEAATCALTGVLVVNAMLPDPQVWPLYLVVGLVAAADGLQRPSLEALIPRIVAHDQQAAAAALSSFRWNVGAILGPAIGGVLVATVPLGVLGQARAGGVAAFTGVRTSIISGGVMCVASVAGLASALTRFWSYDDRTNEHALRQREARTAAVSDLLAVADG